MDQSYATADRRAHLAQAWTCAGVIVPSKVYNVLASGRPCIAAVEDDCEVADIIPYTRVRLCCRAGRRSGLTPRGFSSTSPQDRGKAADFGTRARQAALEFDRPRQVAAYDALLREIATGC
jgi:hypothetical protein